MKKQDLSCLLMEYEQYGQDFTIPTFAKMKKDISARLAHKRPYVRIEQTPDLQIDLLIVVDQMLTGVYMEKVSLYI